LWYAGQWVENATRPMLSYIDNENFRNVYWSSVTNQAPPDVVVNNSAEANILISTHKKDFTDIIMTGE
jgi:predicted nuclease of predicted toxin-antitoxin system